MNKPLATSVAAILAAATTYSIFTWHHISSIDTRAISSSKTASNLFLNSKSVKTIVNPKDHISHNSSRSIEVEGPEGLSDEAILARFVKGFFGGYVLAPERSVLRTLRLDLVGYDQRLAKLNVRPQIWSASQLSETTLPLVRSKLFGGFQVVDCQLEQESQGSTKTHSFIDFAFGSDTGYLAGVHRFSVWREPSVPDCVVVEYSDTAFNPVVNKRLLPGLLLQLHLVYAMVLFREGVANVVRR